MPPVPEAAAAARYLGCFSLVEDELGGLWLCWPHGNPRWRWLVRGVTAQQLRDAQVAPR